MPPTDRPEARRNVLVFRSALLSYSETFIPAQAERLTRFTARYAGLIPVPGYPLPEDRRLLAANSPLVGKALDAAAIFGLYAPRFSERVRSLAPALIHAHFEEGGLKAQALAGRLKVPLVTTCHGYDVTVEDYRWRRYPGLGAYYQRRRRDLFRRGDLFLGVSRFICDQMLRCGFPKEKVRLHYIGVDAARFVPPSPETPRAPRVLFVGRLVEKKGCADLLRAMALVRRSHPEVELHIAGDGPLRSGLEALAAEIHVNARFLGALPVASIRAAMADCLLLCTPSVRSRSGDSEGLGMVFLEAMASGTPVVSTRHGGIPEVVEDGMTGLLVDERQPEQLAQALGTLLADSGRRTTMGAAGRARVLAHFDLTRQTRLLEDLYAELLS